MHIPSVLITGANRGIGLEFVKQFINLPSPPNIIFATCRNPEKADVLHNLALSNTTVKILKLDMKDESSFPKICQQLEREIGEIGLSLLINNAAITVRKDLHDLTKEDMIETFHINTVSPVLLVKELLPLLKTASSKVSSDALSCARAAVINMTSERGSIENNNRCGSYPYRTSKAALNMVTKTLSLDLKPHGILTFCLHPGSVQTDLGGENALITTATSVRSMLNTIQQANEKHCGLMLNYDGESIPW